MMLIAYFLGICMPAAEFLCEHYHRDVTCENKVTTIDCQQNRIYIVDEFYGRKDRETFVN